MSQLYIHEKIGKNPATGSQDIVQTRKCDAEANAAANGVHNKINMSPSPKVGDIIKDTTGLICYMFFRFQFLLSQTTVVWNKKKNLEFEITRVDCEAELVTTTAQAKINLPIVHFE